MMSKNLPKYLNLILSSAYRLSKRGSFYVLNCKLSFNVLEILKRYTIPPNCLHSINIYTEKIHLIKVSFDAFAHQAKTGSHR